MSFTMDKTFRFYGYFGVFCDQQIDHKIWTSNLKWAIFLEKILL